MKNRLNPFQSNAPFLYPPENGRKPKVFYRFQGVHRNGALGLNQLSNIRLNPSNSSQSTCAYQGVKNVSFRGI